MTNEINHIIEDDGRDINPDDIILDGGEYLVPIEPATHVIDDNGLNINPDDIILDRNIRGEDLVPIRPAQNVAPAQNVVLNGNRTSSFAERVKSNKGKDQGHCR